jgi:type IV pilus assembly protein PilA
MRWKRKHPSAGFSLIELLIVIAIILVIVGIASSSLINAKLNASETAVVREIHSIHAAQTQYSSQFGRFATTLAELGPQTADLIPAGLAAGEKDGYAFSLSTTSAAIPSTRIRKSSRARDAARSSRTKPW